VSRNLQSTLGTRIPGTSLPVCDRTGTGCFAPGTLVRTPAGLIAIERLAPADLVIALDGDVARVRAASRSLARELVRISFSDGTTIDSTPWHRFVDARGDLRVAEALAAGALLRAHDGVIVRVLRVEHVARGGSHEVFNLALERGVPFFANGMPVESSRGSRVVHAVSLLASV
jgi:hypothetical protein